MANIRSAKKKNRQIIRRTAVNGMRMTRIRTFIKKVEEAIENGDKASAVDALRNAQPEMMRGAQRGLAHRNQVSRKISRLSSRIKAMAA